MIPKLILMEIIHDSPYLTELSEKLEKYKYEIDLLEDTYLITSRWKKPKVYAALLFVVIGLIRIMMNRITGLISFAIAIFLFIEFRARLNVFNLGYDNISSIQVSEDSIHVTYSDNSEPMEFIKEKIKSLQIEYTTDGKYCLGSIMLEDDLNVRYQLITLIGKKETEIQSLNEELLKLFQSLLLISRQ